MKKIFEKHGMLRCIGALMDIIGIILFIVAIFVNGATADMIVKLVGIILFILGSLFISFTAEEHRLAKSLFVFIIAAIIMTWLFPYGYFQGADFYEYEFKRIGLVDIGFTLYYAVNFIMDKIIFLFVVTGFYGILSKTSGYQKLIENLANKFNSHTILISSIISIIIFVLTSLLSQTIMVLLFIPFFISILLKMNLDKLTTFAITFGSALVGILGATYGTDSLSAFNYYLGQELTVGLNYRFIIAAVAIVLYNFFLVMRIKKVLKETKKNTKNSNIEDDPFKVEVTKEKVSSVPVIIVLFLATIITILGYVAWETNWGIAVFTKFHEWLTGLETGEDFTIMSYIIGSNADAFGDFKYAFSISIVLLLACALIAFLYKMPVNEFINNFYEGTKKMFKPLLYLIGVYVIFGIIYLSPIIPTICNWALNLVEGFNPYLTSLVAFITSVFHSDFGYTAYTVGGFVASVYSDNLEVAHTIFTSMYGLVQIFMPTSALLVVGLSLMKIDYKTWFKYIWLFVVGMIVILLVLFTVVTYI